MILDSLHKYTREMTKRYVSSKSVVIDATCGNGNDTLFLCELAHRGIIYAFDIQQEAIDNTKLRCENYSNVEYICDSHANMNKYIQTNNVSCITFNLGYLPNSQSTIMTNSDSTIKALESSLELLKPGGAILLTIYTGHDKHQEENQIMPFITSLDKYKYNVLKYQFLNLIDPPYLVIIEKK